MLPVVGFATQSRLTVVLARAVRPDQGQDVTTRQVEANTVHRAHPAVMA